MRAAGQQVPITPLNVGIGGTPRAGCSNERAMRQNILVKGV